MPAIYTSNNSPFNIPPCISVPCLTGLNACHLYQQQQFVQHSSMHFHSMLGWPQRLPSIPATTVRPTLLRACPFHAWLASTPAIYTSNQQFVVHTSICIRCICQAVTSMQSSMPTSVLSRNRVEGKEPTCSPLTITHSHAHYQLPPCTHQSKSCTLSAPTTFSSHHALTKISHAHHQLPLLSAPTMHSPKNSPRPRCVSRACSPAASPRSRLLREGSLSSPPCHLHG